MKPPVQTPAPTLIAQPARPRRRWLPRSLTGRLVTGVVVLVAVIVVVTGAGTYFALRSYLYDRLDQQVVATANQPITRILGPTAVDPDAPSPQTIWIIQLDQNGGVLDSLPNDGHVRHMNLTNKDRQRFAEGQLRPSNVTTADGMHLRVVAVQQPRIAGVVVVGLSTSEVVTTLHRLFLLELAIGTAAVAVALIATSYGVQLSLRRLRAVTRTAHEVAAELSPQGAGLERRVPAGEPDTEVGQLAESVNTLLAAVETQFAARVASEERMRQFLADASHELRTPLTSIRGYAELARMQREQHGADAEPANLERIESEGTRMSRLVDDLLTLARSDQAAAAGAVSGTEPVELAGLLADAVEGLRAAHPDRSVTLSAPEPLTVHGDRDALLRVVRNLVTNAAVHTRPDGPIDVRGFRDGHYAVLQVIDAGPGLPPEDAAHVFERFWRADKARSRARGGSGLGLAIVEATVSAHGGLVRFDSTVSDGSTVTVWLPLATG